MKARIFEAGLRTEGPAIIIDLHGEINAFAEEALNAAYNNAASRGESNILLNFEGVDYINSTGLALIVGLLTQARKSSLHLLAFGLTDHYLEIFRTTRLDDFIAIFPDEQSALTNIDGSSEE